MRFSKSEQGFTLVEVLVALCILVVGILGTITVTATVMSGNSLAKRMSTASTLAQYKMEELKTTDYAGLASSSSPETVDRLYSRSWTVSAADTPAAGMKTIEVTVSFSWQGATGTVTFDSIVVDI